MKKPTLFTLLRTSLYLGATAYGGPAMLAPMRKIIVQKHAWLTEDEFMHHLSLAQILPGAIGMNLMGSIGSVLNPRWGGMLLPMTFVFPAWAIITLLAGLYFAFGYLPFIHSIFTGLGALVVALLAHAVVQLGKTLFRPLNVGVLIALAAFAASFAGHWNVIPILLTCGLLGWIFFTPREVHVPPVLQAPVPDLPRLISVWDALPLLMLTGALLIACLVVPTLWTLFKTFFQIGLLAFGGGFASIPLMQHEIVENMHWVSLLVFRDGIALGQITPGPVLITAAFIGYSVHGVMGALIATLGVFSPSVIAATLLSHTHATLQAHPVIRAVLRGFSASFIGLIFAVLLQFGLHSLVSVSTWLIFLVSWAYLTWGKWDTAWLILGTILVSLFLF